MAYAENFRGGAIPRGDNHLWRHTIYDNHVTSQINFRGSAEDTTILGGSGDMPPGKFCKIAPKNTHFCAFWKQVLDNTVFTFFYFEGLRGWPWHSVFLPPYASGYTTKWWNVICFLPRFPALFRLLLIATIWKFYGNVIYFYSFLIRSLCADPF